MGYKVLIADDEPMIRFGLSSAVQWAEEGLELVGEAGNGQAALDIIAREQVDILITDIKMPIMNGIELTQRAKAINAAIKVIFVSSYSDFEYAREAVKLGVVVDYLLKPTMEPQELAELLRRCKDELDAHQEHMGGSEAAALLEQHLKQLLLHGSADPARLDWPQWLEGRVAIAVWELHAAAGDSALDSFVQMEQACAYLTAHWKGKGLAFITDEQRWAAIVADPHDQLLQEYAQRHRTLMEELRLSCSCVVVAVVADRQAAQKAAAASGELLHYAYRAAAAALDEAFFAVEEVATFREVRSSAGSPAGALPVPDEASERRWLELRDSFSRHMAAGMHELCQADLEEIGRGWQARSATKVQVLHQAQSLLSIIVFSDRTQSLEQLTSRLTGEVQQLTRLRTVAQVRDRLALALEQVWSIGEQPRVVEDAGSAHAIQLALTYIQQRFREDISLQEVADCVYMSRNYFSEQFKRRTGLNFIDFVIQLRLQYAKKLLRTTTLKIYEVAAQSGFNSTRHFLKLFKRECGHTPAEYRNRRD